MATPLPKYGTADASTTDVNLLEAAQNNGEVTQNSVSKLITAFASTALVVDKRNAPPAHTELNVYRVGDTPTGDWATWTEDDLAISLDSAWFNWTPVEGVAIYQVDINTVLVYNGTSWQEGLSSVSTDIAAAGTAQGTATLLTSRINEVITVVAATTDGVRLPPALAGLELIVINDDSADTLNVYPATGDFIDNAAVNVAQTQAAGVVGHYYAIDGADWYSIQQ